MDILEEYKANYELYHAFETAMLDDVLNKVLKYERLNIQLVTSRLKEPTSLGLKISSGAKYKALTDVTDVLGLRIVTTYKNEVPFIVQQLRDAFEIDEANTNTNDAKTESEFGYSSIHLIVFNAKDDTYKTNNKKFHGLKAEIQIRTILQHAWAEISHKIDYKAKEKPGSIYKRKLFRVAAFLELADQEFSSVREDIIKSQKELIPRKLGKISKTPIDNESLQAFIMESDTCNALDQNIANITDSVLHFNEESISQKNLNQIIKLEIETLEELDKKLNNASKEIIKTYKNENVKWIEFRKAFPETHGNSSSPRGISITYMYFYLTGKYE